MTSRVHLAAPALAIALAVAGCGKKGPPLPPLHVVPERVTDLSVRQVGDGFVLAFPRPMSRTDGATLSDAARIEILMTAREPAPKHPIDLQLHPDITWEIPHGEWDSYARGRHMEVRLGEARIAASLAGAQEHGRLSGRKVSFIVQVVEPKRKRSDPSDIVSLVVCATPPAPTGPGAHVQEDGVAVAWSTAGPAGTVRFNLYRRKEGETAPDRPLNTAPLESTSYLDTTAVIGTKYLYFVRAIVAGGCESADSGMMPVTRVDTFPPEAPQGLAAVSEAGTIRLFWRLGRAPDLHGYRVYRAKGAQPSEEDWVLLTPEDLTTTSYTDKDVEPGVVYSYAVTARDGASPPNESPRSEPAVERSEPRP